MFALRLFRMTDESIVAHIALFRESSEDLDSPVMDADVDAWNSQVPERGNESRVLILKRVPVPKNARDITNRALRRWRFLTTR